MKVWCYLKNIEQPIRECYEVGCADPEFMAFCLGKKPTDKRPSRTTSTRARAVHGLEGKDS
jgi:hypothetical protein